MEVSVVPLHHNKKYLQDCCRLINEEWKRSDTARMWSLESSSDTLPTSLILLQDAALIGHLKLSPIPSIRDACFVESVVIEKKLRGRGFGTLLMEKAEGYCRNVLYLSAIYLSTKGQEKFYTKLGYTECLPISIYGNYTPVTSNTGTVSINDNNTKQNAINKGAPHPPPMPQKSISITQKTFMRKDL